MGCDMHIYVEVKTEDGWLLYNSVSPTARNYELFGKVAGVRNSSINPIDSPRGLPADISQMTKIAHDYEGDNVHSETYLTSKEVEELREWWEEYQKKNDMNSWEFDFEEFIMRGYFFGNGFTIGGCRPTTVEDFRFVIWFDS